MVASRKNTAAGAAAPEGFNFLSCLLASPDLTEDERMDELVLFIFGGYETTSVTLTWLMLHLGPRPDVQRKVAEEVPSSNSALLPFLRVTALCQVIRVCGNTQDFTEEQMGKLVSLRILLLW
jgi:cytochrome P450